MSKLDKQPLISIILPCFNGEEYLSGAIESCLKQTVTNFELIIVDDSSTDNSLEVARSFARIDNRIIIIENMSNKKLPRTLNIGHQAASGEFYTWTSHDNLLKPDFLKALLVSLKNSGSDIAFSDYLVIYEDGAIKRRHTAGPVESLLFGNSIGPSFLYKKEVFHALKGYNPDLFLVEDFDFWLRASLYFKFCHVTSVLYSYRLHPNSLTSGIQQNSANGKKHKEGRSEMIKATAVNLNWNSVTTELVSSILLGQNFSLRYYFKNMKIIEKDLEKYCGKFLKLKKTKAALSSVLRSHLQSSKKERHFLTLLQIIQKDRRILFQDQFSKKETVKLVYDCLRMR